MGRFLGKRKRFDTVSSVMVMGLLVCCGLDVCFFLHVTWRLVYVVVKLVLRVRAGMLYDHELITCKLVTFVHCIPF